jgi:hypothetical protein
MAVRTGTLVSTSIELGTDASYPRCRGRSGYLAGAITDLAPPVITILSPTPGVAPGAPGGFPVDWVTARNTPIVLQVIDATPGGLAYLAIVARFGSGAQEQTVYRRGAFRGDYAALSIATSLPSGVLLQVRNINGWPPGGVTFAIDPVDKVGNLT